MVVVDCWCCVDGKDVQISTAVGDVALFQSNHSCLVDANTRRSIPLSERDTSTVVVYLADVVDGQRSRYRVVINIGPVHALTSTGCPAHHALVAVASRVRQALVFNT